MGFVNVDKDTMANSVRSFHVLTNVLTMGFVIIKWEVVFVILGIQGLLVKWWHVLMIVMDMENVFLMLNANVNKAI